MNELPAGFGVLFLEGALFGHANPSGGSNGILMCRPKI
jgi:hypothetical protein